MQLFFHFEHLEAIVGLLKGLISILLYLRIGRPRRGRERGRARQSSSQAFRKHIYSLSLPFDMGMVCGAQSNYSGNIKDHWSQTDNCNKYNNNTEKCWNVARITRMWHRDAKWANAIGKMVPVCLVEAGLPQTLHWWRMQCLQSMIQQHTVKLEMPILCNQVTDTICPWYPHIYGCDGKAV